MEGNPAMTGLETLARQNMEWFDSAMRMFSPTAGVADKAEPTPVSTNEEAPDVELGDLKAQLAQMQDQLSKLVDKS